jgi:hypothetical protein
VSLVPREPLDQGHVQTTPISGWVCGNPPLGPHSPGTLNPPALLPRMGSDEDLLFA